MAPVKRWRTLTIPKSREIAKAPVLRFTFVRYRLFVILALLTLFACGKSLEKQIENHVEGVVGADLDDEKIKISEIRESGDYATANVEVTMGVKMKREGRRWTLDEIRIDDRHWEKVSRLVEALDQVRREDTRKMIDAISNSIRGYEALEGKVPQVDSFETLIDLLNPAYLDRVIRLDAWSNPFRYEAAGMSSFELRSAGKDGKFGSKDDVVSSN